jgi:hypothetical protein
MRDGSSRAALPLRRAEMGTGPLMPRLAQIQRRFVRPDDRAADDGDRYHVPRARRQGGPPAGYLNHIVHGNRPVPSNDVIARIADSSASRQSTSASTGSASSPTSSRRCPTHRQALKRLAYARRSADCEWITSRARDVVEGESSAGRSDLTSFGTNADADALGFVPFRRNA